MNVGVEILFKTNFRRLVYFAFQLTGNKETAEDIVQEVFLKYYYQPGEIDLEDQVALRYLYSAVKNASLNVIRHQKVTEKFKINARISELDEDTIIHTLIQTEVINELHAAIKLLPEGCRQIFNLSFIEEKKNQEIAEELGISVNTVKSQKQRALQLLRLRLTPEIYCSVIFLFNV